MREAIEECYVAEASRIEKQVDAALGLQMISIRLQKSVIADFKKLAIADGLVYQALIRHVLTKYAKRRIKRSKAA